MKIKYSLILLSSKSHLHNYIWELVAFLNRERPEHMLKHFPESGQELYVKYNLYLDFISDYSAFHNFPHKWLMFSQTPTKSYELQSN